ncbi:MAG: hypothetical protein RIQ81_941 [Pseudomonadota bacterium]
MAKTPIKMILLTLWAQSALGVTPDRGSNWQAKTYMPVDPAGSKGSQSFAIGFGTVMNGAAGKNSDERSGSTDTVDSLMRLHLTKGLPIPVDLGMILGASPNGRTQQAGGHLQWTVFEGFRLPAVSVRGAMMRTYAPRSPRDDGQSQDKVWRNSHEDTRSLELIASWGFLGILTPYAGAGQIHTGEDSSFQKVAGLEIQMMPPFARLSFEARTAFDTDTLAAKISLGL